MAASVSRTNVNCAWNQRNTKIKEKLCAWPCNAGFRAVTPVQRYAFFAWRPVGGMQLASHPGKKHGLHLVGEAGCQMRLKNAIKSYTNMFRLDHMFPLKCTFVPDVTDSCRCLPYNYMARWKHPLQKVL